MRMPEPDAEVLSRRESIVRDLSRIVRSRRLPDLRGDDQRGLDVDLRSC